MIRLTLILVFAFALPMTTRAAFPLPMPLKRTNAVLARVMVAWEPSPSTNVVSYSLYWGTNGHRMYSCATNVTGTNVVVRIPAGVTNWIAATALDEWGLESDYSDELVHVPVLIIKTNVVIELQVRLLTGTNWGIGDVQDVFTVFVTNPIAPWRWWRSDLRISKTHF